MYTGAIGIKCPEVSPPKYGKIHITGYYPGDRLRYDCIYGYKLTGSERRVCLHKGVWSGSNADCVKDKSYDNEYKYQSHRKSYDGDY